MEHQIDPTFTPKSLKAARRAANITPEKLAEKIGVTLTSLTNWEHGEREPNKHSKEILKAFIRENLPPAPVEDQRIGATAAPSVLKSPTHDAELEWAMKYFSENRADVHLVLAFKTIMHRHAATFGR